MNVEQRNSLKITVEQMKLLNESLQTAIRIQQEQRDAIDELQERIRSRDIQMAQMTHWQNHLESVLGANGLKKAQLSYERRQRSMMNDIRAETLVSGKKRRCTRGYRRGPDGSCIRKISQRRR